MAKSAIKIHGADQVARQLKAAGVDVSRGLEVVCSAGAEVVQKAIRARAPGNLAQGVIRETTEKSKERVTVSTGPVNRQRHAHLIEYGVEPHETAPDDKDALAFDGHIVAWASHPGIVARPFVRPAADETRSSSRAAMGDAVGKIIG